MANIVEVSLKNHIMGSASECTDIVETLEPSLASVMIEHGQGYMWHRHGSQDKSDEVAQSIECESGQCFLNAYRAIALFPDLRFRLGYMENTLAFEMGMIDPMPHAWLVDVDGRLVDVHQSKRHYDRLAAELGDYLRKGKSTFHYWGLEIPPEQLGAFFHGNQFDFASCLQNNLRLCNSCQ